MSQAVNVGYSNTNTQGILTVTVEIVESSDNWEGQSSWQPTVVTNHYAILEKLPFTTTGAKQTFAVPTGAAGYLIQPPTGGGSTLKVATNAAADAGDFVSQTAPTGPVWFDTTNLPTNLYVTSGTNGVGGYMIYWL